MTRHFYLTDTVIQAEQKEEAFTVMTPEGEIVGRRHDYECSTPDGRRFPMRRELFEALFHRGV